LLACYVAVVVELSDAAEFSGAYIFAAARKDGLGAADPFLSFADERFGEGKWNSFKHDLSLK